MKATTLSCSTIRLAMARAAAGSPPSSPKISLTGCPASPPRALTSALQALSAVMIGWTARPMTPLPVPNVPNTIAARAAPVPVSAGDPGPAAVPDGVAPAAEPGAEDPAPDDDWPAATATALLPPGTFPPGRGRAALGPAADGPSPPLAPAATVPPPPTAAP